MFKETRILGKIELTATPQGGVILTVEGESVIVDSAKELASAIAEAVANVRDAKLAELESRLTALQAEAALVSERIEALKS